MMKTSVMRDRPESIPLWARRVVFWGAALLMFVCCLSYAGYPEVSTLAPQRVPYVSMPIRVIESKPVLVEARPAVRAQKVIAPRIRYTLQGGDTLSQLADRYCTTIEDILSHNVGNPAIKSRHLIIAGRALTIQKGGKCTSPEMVEPKVQPEKSIVKDGTSRTESFVVPQSQRHSVSQASSAPALRSPNVNHRANTEYEKKVHPQTRSHVTMVPRSRLPSEQEMFRQVWDAHGVIISAAAKVNHVPVDVVMAIIAIESRGRPKAVGYPDRYDPRRDVDKVSYGLMQLTIPTALRFQERLGQEVTEEMLFDPERNIRSGIRALAYYWRQSPAQDICFALASYNMGPVTASRMQKGGTDLCSVPYVTKVRQAMMRVQSALPESLRK